MTEATEIIRIRAARRMRGTVEVPGDKSIAHRALLFSAIADGPSCLTGLPTGADVASTMSVLQSLGVKIEGDVTGELRVHGRGMDGLIPSSAPLDCGNSGTTMRLCMGLLSGRSFESALIGDASLTRRPMKRVADPMQLMGAQIAMSDGLYPPVTIHGTPLRGIDYSSPIASAQVKSALLLAGLQASGKTRVIEPSLSRNHTELMLEQMGASIVYSGCETEIEASSLNPLGHYRVAGDQSSAAFLVAASVLLPDANCSIEHVGFNPTRTGFFDTLESMGVPIDVSMTTTTGEPMATLSTASAALRSFTLAGDALVRAIDEVPILAVLATQAQGRSVISDAAELRVKESDRLATTAAMLNAMGGRVEETADGLIIEGPTPLRPASIECHHDHRIALAGAVAGLIAQGDGWTELHGGDCADVSYPTFFQDIQTITDATVERVK